MPKIQVLIIASVLVCCFSSLQALAQNCKPNYSGKDAISKQQVDQWSQSLFSTGFGSSLISTSQISIVAIVGRYGEINSISLQIQKQEESKQNATFESEYRAVKGNQFFFGIKNGEPLSFVATEVSNQTKAGGLITGKLITTVVLSATISNKDIAIVRDALSQKQIDSIRIILAGDLRIEKTVNDKDSKKMMEKFSCFYQSLDKRLIDFSSDAVDPNQPLKPMFPSNPNLSGKYVRKDDNRDYFELSQDGTIFLKQGGKEYKGNYNSKVDTITVQIENTKAETMSISGDTIIDKQGTIWAKLSEPQKTAVATQLTTEQVMKMVEAKLPDDVIIATIRKSGSKFDLTPEALIKLKTAGVSDAVIRAMTQ